MKKQDYTIDIDEPADESLQTPYFERYVTPRVCSTCKFFRYETMSRNGKPEHTGSGRCIRPAGPTFDLGDMKQWMTTCNRYSKAK